MRKVIRTSMQSKRIQAADFDAEAFKQRHKAAQERHKLNREERIERTIEQIRESENSIEEAFDILVPDSGEADTKAGELIRAIMRILYRDYNDGDVFYEGYGIETCGDAVAFLCDQIPELEDKFEDIAMRTLQDNSYTKSIEAISREVLDYIYANPELVVEKNDIDMFSYDGEDFIKDRDWEPKYDFECDLPDSILNHIEAGNIDEADVEDEIEGWDGIPQDADIRVSGYSLYIPELPKDYYDELEYHMERWLDEWGNDLDEEYGVPGEEEDEED